MSLHRICWACYHYYFDGTAAAKLIDETGATELAEPKRCHFCGEPTTSVMEMYRHPSSVLARDCADIHAEEAPAEVPVRTADSPYPEPGEIAFDTAGRIMEWSAEDGWHYPAISCEHEKRLHELQEQLDLANQHLVEVSTELARAWRNLLRPHSVLAGLFEGFAVVGERDRELGEGTLFYALPTGSVAVRARLADLDLLEGLHQVSEAGVELPTERESFEAMAAMAAQSRRVMALVLGPDSKEQPTDLVEAFNNYELAEVTE